MKKKAIFYVFLLVIIAGAFYITFKFQTSPTYTLSIPADNKITSIDIDGYQVTDKDSISSIAKIFRGKVTKIQSTNDSPVNSDEEFIVTIENTMIYVYKKSGRYYALQPYNGIYKISKNDYMLVRGFKK